ncbi:SGNH/GDSL hydrolase family protein [Leptospira wolffii]|uniref:SGNH/GDSL hydrolase family protein n=1 Tax=Leptospira wolffii TaxID=409998 RepID=A0ABV5BMQ7_9LEPT|nr:SGNH/GDSL hydrolase family protein [Leptospira wolffii]EPG65191.1 GDSL-like protein [Leptospira wolffii serovar Khorat str. Khorat-H2]TGL52428.1 SGNH/GDSL hydrolase family protein [Leptospira wolffii]
MKVLYPISFLAFLLIGCYSQNDAGSLSGLLPGSEPISVTVLGDSLCERSQGFGLREGLGSNFAITEACVSLRGAADWLPELNLALTNTPRLIIIELGLNDLLYHPIALFPDNYSALLSELGSRSNAVLMVTVLPIPTTVYRSDIQNMNLFLKGLGSNHPLADMETPFLAAESQIELYPVTDPIHPTPAGYAIMKTVYISAVAKLFNLPSL